jgi:hydroxyacylglutathione hydrolase
VLEFCIIPVTPFQQNCSIIWCSRTRRAAVIDPGGELERVIAEAERRGLVLEKILLTHGHLDHAGATAQLSERLALPIEGPQVEDTFWIDSLPQFAPTWGFPPSRSFTPDRWLSDGDRVNLGELELQVRHCPGHTPGHVIFFEPESRVAFVGDVLFAGSIGRSDFPRGDHGKLIDSIRTRLFALGDDVRFVPGHGPMSSFGHERRSNPFVADHLFPDQ